VIYVPAANGSLAIAANEKRALTYGYIPIYSPPRASRSAPLRFRDILHFASGRCENHVEERRDTQPRAARSIGAMWGQIWALLNSRSIPSAKLSTPKSEALGSRHDASPSVARSHRVDAIVEMN